MEWRDLPPLTALRAFSAFVDKGGVQEAGSALNVSHAAVSQQLRLLETHLGVALLDRSGRAIVLTAEGKLLADTLDQSFAQIATVVSELTGAEADRPLHITTTTSFAAYWLMPRLPSFRARHPEIDFIIAPDPRSVDPTPGGVDLAIRFGEGRWPGLEAAPLVMSPVIGVAAPSLVGPQAAMAPRELAQFDWYEELGTHEGSRWLTAQGVEKTAGRISAPATLTLDAARSGQGIAIITRIAVEADLAAGRLVTVFEDPRTTGYYLLVRPGVQRPPLRQFVAWLRREIKTAKT